ncbi:putative sporulation protein YtxC [Chengkuizengella axinellae]|uniref:Sporulation protein YtxC n=1 Tax=Chengkuizengella axinellae TaxID=3064388 RepID=A0ABT9J0N7_9BACL|nr:putative sporulation protein YtxC [Chengkuizengella sp. 2205SS18-9]MDP5275181.1 putative sporulation protein YtxC [Chengkuizengella sp. 2205SS18-9]
MNLITISMDHFSEEEIRQCLSMLQSNITFLHKKNKLKKQVFKMNKNDSNLICTGVLPQFQLTKHAALLYQSVSKTFSEFILTHLQNKLIHNLIKKEHPHFNQIEISRLSEYCTELLNEPSQSSNFIQKKQQKIEKLFYQYVENNTWINLDGFIRFRLQFYLQELNEVVEYAIEEYISDQQYKDFMTLLKTFVSSQEHKIPTVHIIHNGENDFLVLDEQLKCIDVDGSADSNDGIQDKNFDDLIITKLVSISPQKIIIHTRKPEMQVIHVIQQIFEKRTFICKYCNVCEKILSNYRKAEK